MNIQFHYRHSYWWSLFQLKYQSMGFSNCRYDSDVVEYFLYKAIQNKILKPHLTTGFLFLVTFFLFLLLPYDHVVYTKFSPSMGSKQNKWVSMQHYTIQRNQHRWFHCASLSSSLVNPLGTACVQENNS